MNNAIAQEKLPPSKLKRLSEHMWKINELIQEMNRLQVDDYEYAFLRFITIFNAGNISFFYGQLYAQFVLNLKRMTNIYVCP